MTGVRSAFVRAVGGLHKWAELSKEDVRDILCIRWVDTVLISPSPLGLHIVWQENDGEWRREMAFYDDYDEPFELLKGEVGGRAWAVVGCAERDVLLREYLPAYGYDPTAGQPPTISLKAFM